MSQILPLTQEIIRRKRDGHTLIAAEIEALVGAMVDGSASDAQLAAFAMAVLLNGMGRAETAALTIAMARSGQTLDWRGAGLSGPCLDKHSSGGVGDKVSLVLAPLLAACGAYVPMVSGRGLGHTGGTLDKLEAIPGYKILPAVASMQCCMREAGCAIVGAGPEIAPADRRLYAVRDVTATVESTPLIVSSILSKKLAAGLDALVLDVKFGSGAFAGDVEDATTLARELTEVANAAGLRTEALLTDMNQVLGRTAGNALEVRESIAFLRGDARDPRLAEVTLDLAARALVLGTLASDMGDARSRLAQALDGGAAAERFERMVAGLGGPADLLDHPDRHLAAAPVRVPVAPSSPGWVSGMDVRAIGLAVVTLGGGRRLAEDCVDPRVGFSNVAGIGEMVDAERPLALVHAADESSARAAARALREAVRVAPRDRTRAGARAPRPSLGGPVRAAIQVGSAEPDR